MNVQPTIDALSAEIAKLTSARDALQALQKPGRVRTITAVAAPPKAQKTAPKKKPTPSAKTQRAKWAEAKRLQRERDKKEGTK